jgi:hypothetical protein
VPRSPATREDAEVGVHGRGSNSPGSQVNGGKHCRSEPTESLHDPRAKRRKTQQSEDGQGHNGISNLSDDSLGPQAPFDGLTQGEMAGGKGTLPTAVMSHHQLGDPYESNSTPTLPMHGGEQLCGSDGGVTYVRAISSFDLLVAAAEQQALGATTDIRCSGDGQPGNGDGPFCPRGDPRVMLGGPEQPGAAQCTKQNPRPEQVESRWRGTTYSMMDIAYDVDDDSSWKELVDFDPAS